MKPRIKIASARTPDGSEMELLQHDRDFFIKVNGEDLMHSRHYESELELARLGCARLGRSQEPCVLVGGLGMGYTLRETLDLLVPQAEIVVGELMEAIVEWNRRYFGELNGRPLEDQRVRLVTGDVLKLISGSRNRFDAILLDVDNGPKAMTDSGNSRLYGYEGVMACRQALRKKGNLAVWSAAPCKDFEEILIGCGFHVRRYRVPAYKGSKNQSRFVWVASESEKSLPPGGGEPQQPKQTSWKKSRKKR
ncbi:MAG: hypothetical protein KKG47_06830 [Proteobacteria bacterium]|nr:hypothetical protein [Pseudomonadota bacterium]MBU1739119.1 hypothetical protein [Pseudomonadota bacterium]